jgi:hypothetical protein
MLQSKLNRLLAVPGFGADVVVILAFKKLTQHFSYQRIVGRY